MLSVRFKYKSCFQIVRSRALLKVSLGDEVSQASSLTVRGWTFSVLRFETRLKLEDSGNGDCFLALAIAWHGFCFRFAAAGSKVEGSFLTNL